MTYTISELMEESGVKFGTSGARGLAADMTDRICYAYTIGFLQHLKSLGEPAGLPGAVAIAGDLRPSTPRIMEAVRRACVDAGWVPRICGRIPAPAVALYGLVHRIPAIMVTGSHIPDDRNGIKFNKRGGEILKTDEAGIRAQVVDIEENLFDRDGQFWQAAGTPPAIDPDARQAYVQRYLDFFAPGSLDGMRIGVYQHSAVGRDLLDEVLSKLGAQTTCLGRSAHFVPVDTEAIRPEDVALAAAWARDDRFDAIVSTDGDSDRPLIGDESGCWLRGDVAGILCARYLEADAVCAPVSCNTAVEKCGWFQSVDRTRIGSPYVIEAMMQAAGRGMHRVVGYEANGGFLTQHPIERNGRVLAALPTRDALIVILAILAAAREAGRSVGALLSTLPQRHTASGRLQNFAQDRSAAVLARFAGGDARQNRERIESIFGGLCGRLQSVDTTDGVRMTFANDEVVHLRPSGNAPEFRCYNEAAGQQRADALNAACLDILAGLE